MILETCVVKSDGGLIWVNNCSPDMIMMIHDSVSVVNRQNLVSDLSGDMMIHDSVSVVNGKNLG